MREKKAKLIFKHNSFEILEEGDYVLCAVSGKKIMLQKLTYWNVDLQEAYFSANEFLPPSHINCQSVCSNLQSPCISGARTKNLLICGFKPYCFSNMHIFEN